MSAPDRARAGLLFLATLALYVWVAPSHFVYGDNAEFAGLAQLGGVAHPPGYPAYVLWLRLWSWVPLDGVVAAAIATAVLAALQMGVLYAACRAWGATSLAAVVAVGLYGVSPIALRIHSQAEVFALNGLVVAVVLWISAREGPVRGGWRVVLLALIAGLGIANHPTCVLAAPIGVLGVARGLRETRGSRTVALGGLVALGIGLLPYLYLFVAPASRMSWGAVDGVSALVHHFLRDDYGGPWGLSGHGANVLASENLIAFARSVGRAYWYVPAVAGLGALGVRACCVQHADGEPRAGWIALGVSFVLAGPLLFARFNIAPVGLHRYVLERFHLLPLALFSVPIAVALDSFGTWIRSSARWHKPRLLAGVGIASLGCAAASSLPSVARAHSGEVECGLLNVLRSVPRDALLLVTTDSAHFGLGYLQAVRGERRDVTVITTPQLGRARYRDALRSQIGIEVDAMSGQPVVDLVEQLLPTKRPVFIDPFQAAVARAFPTYPYGIVFRVVPRGTTPPSIGEVFELNRGIFERYRFDYAWPTRGQPTELHQFYARAWRMIADGLVGAGLRQQHAAALEMAAALSARDD